MVRDQILLPTPVVFEHPAVAVIGDAFVAIPIVGFARAAAIADYRKRLGAALTASGLDLRNEFQKTFALELRTVSAPVVTALTVSRAAPKAFKLQPNEKELPKGAPTDCFIDVLLGYGFVAPVTGAEYEPYMVVNLQVLRGDHSVTYAETFFYNFLGRNIEVAPATPLPSWQTVDAAERDIATARDAFRTATAELSKFVATHLQAQDHLGKC